MESMHGTGQRMFVIYSGGERNENCKAGDACFIKKKDFTK